MQAAAARFAWEQGCASSRGTRHHGSRGFALQHTSAARQPAAPPGAVAERVEAASSDGGALRVIDTELRVETEQSYLAVRAVRRKE